MSLHALHHGTEPLILPNAWDVASAVAFMTDGFPAIGTTSLGVAASGGVRDASRGLRAETLALAQSLAALPCSISVDIEDGFTHSPELAADFVATLTCDGINIEDSTDGRLIDPEEHAAKIAAIKDRCPGVFVNARVDTFWLGQNAELSTTIARLRRYEAAGADGVFVPGSLSSEQIGVLARETAAPLNVLASQNHSVVQLAELGVRRISTGSLPYRAALDAARDVARRVRDDRAPAGVISYEDVQDLTDRYLHLRRAFKREAEDG